MRHSLPLAAIALLAATAAHAQPPAAQHPTRLEQVAPEQLFGECAGRDADCPRRRQAFLAAYPRALAGELRAQRDVTSLLMAMRPNPTPVEVVAVGCAWRQVVLAWGHANVDFGDIENMVATCFRIAPALRGMPGNWDLGNHIYSQGTVLAQEFVRAAQRRREPPPPPGLDGTARPLTAEPPRPRG